MSNPSATVVLGDSRQTLESISKIGRQVWVKMDDDTDNHTNDDIEQQELFTQGEIIKVEMRKEDYDESIVIEHCIALANGQKKWFNLFLMEKIGQAVWENPVAVTTPTPVKQEESSSLSGNDLAEKQEKKRSRGDETSNNNAKKNKTRVAKREEEQDEVNSEVLSKDEEEDDEVSKTDINVDRLSLDSKTKKWIDQLGLTNAHGKEKQGLNRIIANKKYAVPESLEQVLLLTDFLFPRKEYHSRLFAKAARPGIAVRQHLRKRQKKDPKDPLVSWHQPRQEWLPPTASVLVGMVNVIVDM
jgi:hypothetical protein